MTSEVFNDTKTAATLFWYGVKLNRCIFNVLHVFKIPTLRMFSSQELMIMEGAALEQSFIFLPKNDILKYQD